MKHCKKSAFTIIICFILILQLLINVNAHSSTLKNALDHDGDLIGSEEIGWIVDEGYHMNSTTVTYTFASNITKEFESYVSKAAENWSVCAKVLYDASNPTVTFGFYDSSIPSYFYSYVAVTHEYNVDNNGHIKSCKISFNPDYYTGGSNELDANIIIKVLTHEIGHVFGLKDLKSSSNRNKLMYYTYASTATAPTSSDIKGFNVITGRHVTHEWLVYDSYAQCTICDGIHTHLNFGTSWYDYDNYCHMGKCAVCGATVSEPHSAQWNSSKQRCERCGHTGSIIVTGKAHLQQTPSPVE